MTPPRFTWTPIPESPQALELGFDACQPCSVAHNHAFIARTPRGWVAVAHTSHRKTITDPHETKDDARTHAERILTLAYKELSI